MSEKDPFKLEPKPAFDVPLPLWGKITILVVAVLGIVAITIYSFVGFR